MEKNDMHDADNTDCFPYPLDKLQHPGMCRIICISNINTVFLDSQRPYLYETDLQLANLLKHTFPFDLICTRLHIRRTKSSVTSKFTVEDT